MAEKIDIYRSYGEKLISLFVRLLFSGESYSLTELSQMLGCSKQTILRLLDDIDKAYNVKIEERMDGKRKFVSLRKPRPSLPMTSLTVMELTVLQMCRDFTFHLLGNKLFEEATRALLKSRTLLDEGARKPQHNFGAFNTGYIDYTPFSGILCTLVEAMENKQTCKLTYQAIMENKAKTYYVNPLKIFSHKDTVYLHAQWTPTPKGPFKEPDFDPLLAIHRMKKIEMTDRTYDWPKNYDFDKIFNKHFGLIKKDEFEIDLEFSGWTARYVAERIWSTDQKITKIDDAKIRLTFSASSEVELIAWILSFGEEVKVINPEWLVKEILSKVERTASLYCI